MLNCVTYALLWNTTTLFRVTFQATCLYIPYIQVYSSCIYTYTCIRMYLSYIHTYVYIDWTILYEKWHRYNSTYKGQCVIIFITSLIYSLTIRNYIWIYICIYKVVNGFFRATSKWRPTAHSRRNFLGFPDNKIGITILSRLLFYSFSLFFDFISFILFYFFLIPSLTYHNEVPLR